MKLGIIISNYNCVELIEDFFEPWVQFAKNNPQHLIIFSVIDTRFKGNGDNETNESDCSNDGSLEILRHYYASGIINHYLEYGKPIMEHEARTIALKPLLNNKCDYVLSTAFDEHYTVQDIENIIKFVEKKPLITWFSINYKNYVFDRSHFVLGFCPPRIFKVNYFGYELHKWAWDDDPVYTNNKDTISYKNMVNMVIPNVLVKHYTWLSNDRSRSKIFYQEKHFAHGAGCGYKWNEETKSVEFNLEHYKKIGQIPPQVYQE